MEKTAEKTTKKKTGKAQLKNTYMAYVLTEGKEPRSVFAFAKQAKITEEEFYNHYNSLQSLERALWTDWTDEVLNVLEQDETYSGYTTREKLLAFYFAWFEKMRAHRSYVLYRMGRAHREPDPVFLKGAKERFRSFAEGLVSDGKSSGEVMERPLSEHYYRAFWVQFLFLMRFWARDESEGFAKTDAAIEKSVNLGFDLIGSGPIDRIVDFAKFLFQNHRPF